MQRRNQQHHSDSEEEAQEVNQSLDVHSQPPSQEDESGEDLVEEAELDYQPIPDLDRYESEGVDNEEYEMNPEARRKAEKEIDMRYWLKDGEQELEEYLQQDLAQQQLRKARRQFYEVNIEEQQEEANVIDPEDEKGGIADWIINPSVRTYIKRHLVRFFTQFKVDGKAIYFQQIKDMCINNKQEIYVEYDHLRLANIKLAAWMVRYPLDILPQFNAVLYVVATKSFPAYKQLIQECFFKVAKLPVLDKIRHFSYTHLGGLVKVRGVVTAVSLVFHQLKKVVYKCLRCGYLKGPFFPNEKSKIFLGPCRSCQTNGPFIINSLRSIYRNYQTLTVQESPSSVEPGRIPRSKQVVVFGDNIDRAKPGDEVQIVGVLSARSQCYLNIKQGFPVFHTFIEVNSIITIQKFGQNSDIDQKLFEAFAKERNFDQRFYNSIAPSIYGHHSIKRALTLALFGGVEKKDQKISHRTRGDLNVLLLGDPGMAKSQFLKSIQKISPRCVYTTGKGASAVGLTASVMKDPLTNEWRLEAGALVLADKGVCLIDQFDKMSEQDRTSIHEAMEQQTISISKAGIVATLNARCSVIAAANPLEGCYNQKYNFRDNVVLSSPILSRFDLLCVIKDSPSQQIDKNLASFVINQHLKSHPYRQIYEQETIELQTKSQSNCFDVDPQFIKQYIKHARLNFHPKLTSKTSTIIKQFYMKLREQSMHTGGLDIVVRHLQSMIRVAEANARMHLRKETNEQDAKLAISTLLQSFIQTQKYATAQRIKKLFKDELLFI